MMDVVGVVQNYILTLLEEAGPGMKVMLLDSETTPAVSLAFAQSALMRPSSGLSPPPGGSRTALRGAPGPWSASCLASSSPP